MKEISADRIEEILAEYSVRRDTRLVANLQTYISLLLKWNQKISLTTITDPEEIVRIHFGESLFAASAVPIRVGRLADVGTGPGFPGIPLRMSSEQIDLTLVESNVKKSAFLHEVIRALSLDHVTVFHGRMEDFPSSAAGFDFITARALGSYEDLLRWAAVNLSAGGKVVLWLGEDDSQAISSIAGWRWRDSVPIPLSKRRCLLIGSLQ